MQANGLSDRQSTSASDYGVDPGIVLVSANDRLQNFRCRDRRIGIETDHRATDVMRRDADGGCIIRLAEGEYSAQPLALLKRTRLVQANHDIRTKSSHVVALTGKPADLAHGIPGDHGNTRVIEDALSQLHHLHGTAVPASDFHGEVVAEHRQLFAIRRANMRWQVSPYGVSAVLRSKEKQFGKFRCCQPWEPAVVIKPPKCEPPVAIQAVPAQLGNLEWFPPHGLNGIPENCLYMSDFYWHLTKSANGILIRKHVTPLEPRPSGRGSGR